MRCWMIKCDTGLDKRFFVSNNKGTVINFQLGLVGQYRGFFSFVESYTFVLFVNVPSFIFKPALTAVPLKSGLSSGTKLDI